MRVNYKLQVSNNKQATSTNYQNGNTLGILNLEFVCHLDIEIWDLVNDV